MSPVESKIITPTLVADQVYDVLERTILTGELAAGSPLRVRDVATMVGTSVMPVREAIRRLEEAGLVERVPHKGAVVKTFTVAELIHIYDVRTILEVDAATRGAPNISKTELRQMQAVLRKLAKAVENEDAILALDYDEEMLRILYRASGNPVLVNQIDQLWLKCRAYKAIGATEAFNRNDYSLWQPQHEIVAALEAGHPAQITDITRDSLTSAQARLASKLEQTNPPRDS